MAADSNFEILQIMSHGIFVIYTQKQMDLQDNVRHSRTVFAVDFFYSILLFYVSVAVASGASGFLGNFDSFRMYEQRPMLRVFRYCDRKVF